MIASRTTSNVPHRCSEVVSTEAIKSFENGKNHQACLSREALGIKEIQGEVGGRCRSEWKLTTGAHSE